MRLAKIHFMCSDFIIEISFLLPFSSCGSRFLSSFSLFSHANLKVAPSKHFVYGSGPARICLRPTGTSQPPIRPRQMSRCVPRENSADRSGGKSARARRGSESWSAVQCRSSRYRFARGSRLSRALRPPRRLNDTALFARVKRALTSTIHAEPAGPRGGGGCVEIHLLPGPLVYLRLECAVYPHRGPEK